MIKKAVLWLLFLNCCLSAVAQDRYMVFFNDKNGSAYSLSNPSEFLSERAILRRSRQQVALNITDLPVNEAYVESLRTLGAIPFYRTKWMNGVLVHMDGALAAEVLALDFVTRVEFVAPGVTFEEGSSGGDGGEAYDMDAAQSDNQNQMLGIDRMHADGYRGEGLMIGVFDGGFDNLSRIPALSHLFEENRLLYTFDFTENESDVENTVLNHGTRVLSTLAGNEPGNFVGTAPEATYLLCATEDEGEYRVEEYYWLFAAERADSAGVDIINTSLGYYTFSDPSMDYTQAEMDGQTAVITQAANAAASKGILIFTSAGNTGLNLSWPIITAPGDSPNVITVGAVNAILERARFSSGGPTADARTKPDVMALGVATAVVSAGGSVTFSDGTSFSSPQVAGLAAGLWQAHPEFSAAQMRTLIRRSGDRYDNPDNEVGYGVPNYVTAIRIADELDLPTVPELTAFPNPVFGTVLVLAFDQDFIGEEVRVEAVNTQGSRVNSYIVNPTERDNRINIDLGPVPPGVYLLRISSASGNTVKRIIKR